MKTIKRSWVLTGWNENNKEELVQKAKEKTISELRKDADRSGVRIIEIQHSRLREGQGSVTAIVSDAGIDNHAVTS